LLPIDVTARHRGRIAVALIQRNQPPRFFSRGGAVVSLILREENPFFTVGQFLDAVRGSKLAAVTTTRLLMMKMRCAAPLFIPPSLGIIIAGRAD